MTPAPKILVINPGSTSTKVAVFRGRKCVFDKELKHPSKSLARYDSVLAQLDFRRRAIQPSGRCSATNRKNSEPVS